MPINSKASCFLDAAEIALGVPAESVATMYRTLVDHDPDVDGYHPSVVNQILLEVFGIGMTLLDFRPTLPDGTELEGRVCEELQTWFDREGFRAVVVGHRASDGEPHAWAFRNGHWIDPATGRPNEESFEIVGVWCLSVPERAE